MKVEKHWCTLCQGRASSPPPAAGLASSDAEATGKKPAERCLPLLLVHDVLEHFADIQLGQNSPVVVGEDGIYVAPHPVQRGQRLGWGQARKQ